MLRFRELMNPNYYNPMRGFSNQDNLAVQSVNEANQLQEDELIPKFSEELLKQYQDLIAKRPLRPPKPGKMKRLGAQTAAYFTRGDSVGKERLIQGMLYPGYHESLADWEDQLENFKELAGMEGSRNINERVAKSSAMRERARMRQLDITEDRNEQLAKKETEELEIRRKRADAYVQVSKAREWKLKNPQYKFEVGKDGKVYGINQADPSDVVDTGIESRYLDDMDKADLQLRNIRARGEESRKTGEFLEGIRYPEGRPSGRIEAGSSIKARQYAKAREAYNTKPEWQPYIELLPGNDFVLKQPKRGLFGRAGGDPKVYQQINEYIYGKSDKPASTTNKPTKRADGKVHVKRKSDGKTGWVTNPDLTIYELIP